MALDCSPSSILGGLTVGEECSDSLSIVRGLKTRTLASYTYKIYNSAGDEVTPTFGGGSSIADNVITFGIKAVAKGKYKIEFIMTCNEMLPDGETPYQFYVNMTVTIV